MTSPAPGGDLPDYAPVPQSSLGVALNDQGYYVGRVERNLYWVTDGVYQSAFLTTSDGVVLFDAPPHRGNLRRAVDEIAADNGVSNTVTHLVYSHHHADHGAAASLFPTRCGSATRRPGGCCCATTTRPARSRRSPSPTRYSLERRRGTCRTGLARLQPLARQHLHPLPRPRHPDVHRRGQRRVGADLQPQPVRGRARLYGRPRHRRVLPLDPLHLRPSGPPRHPRRRRHPPAVHRRHRSQLPRSPANRQPRPLLRTLRQNAWAGVKAHLDEVTERAAAPVIAKYTGVLAAADIEVFTRTTTFAIMQSLRLDKGPTGPVHP